jgi:2-polyprenyl-3-methyl-5-hydroxy-6-metoxy-1,4-benzoquinol methylase
MSEFNKYRLKGAYHYDWYENEDWYRWLVDKCVNFCDGSTIDIGCGDGLLATKIFGKGNKVTGIDTDQTAINLANEKGVGNFIKQDASELLDGKWEYMSCLNVIEHLDNPEVLKRVIKKNITKGAIIITIDWQGGAFGEDHKKEYTLAELVEFFKEFKPKPFRYKDTEWIGVEIRK